MKIAIKNINNKKILSCFYLFIIIATFFTTPIISLAQNEQNQTGSYTLLAPIPIGDGTGVTDSVALGGEKQFRDYLNNTFKLGIIIAILLAVIMIVIGGIEWMGESVFGKEEGKKKIKNAMTGLVLALSIFLILNTINPDLVNLRLDVGKLTQPPAVTSDAEKGSGSPGTLPDSFSNEREVREMLKNGNISVNKSACEKINQSNCTNVGGLRQNAINGLIKFKKDCDQYIIENSRLNIKCFVQITGGTEYWLHSSGTSHRPGGSTVDLTPDLNGVTRYITGTASEPKNNPAITKNGIKFSWENLGDNAKSTGAHWHVTF